MKRRKDKKTKSKSARVAGKPKKSGKSGSEAEREKVMEQLRALGYI